MSAPRVMTLPRPRDSVRCALRKPAVRNPTCVIDRELEWEGEGEGGGRNGEVPFDPANPITNDRGLVSSRAVIRSGGRSTETHDKEC